MRCQIVVLIVALVASVSALPQMWLTSGLNSNKACTVPAGYTPPPGAMMGITSVIDAKNGPQCAITYHADNKIITVSTNVVGRIGVLLSVSTGSLTKGVGLKKACAYSLGTGPQNFVWVPAANVTTVSASATCGDENSLYTTSNIKLA